MEFGIFDHLDRNDLPLNEFYEARLKLIEAYERAGFYAYHVAEHHSSPIGMAPSPSVFLSAIAQRTKTLRFGPMVYALPLHHPLRLIEEICMVDQLSGGRLEIGFGRGSSPTEVSFYGQDPAQAQDIYTEARALILEGLTHKTLTFEGKFFSFKDIPMELEPLQKPHPPMWYGVHSLEAAERDALTAACRASPVWHKHFYYLYYLKGGNPTHPRPAEFDKMMERGQAVAGNPDTVTKFLQAELDESVANYLVGQFAFGDLSLGESLRSVQLFSEYVMPKLRGT